MSTVRRAEEQTATLTRSAPHNVEAERQLLGAMLMNNETFFRVSDFLEPPHFFIEQHKAIYEKIGQLIRGGKVASPITLKTFYPADYQIAEMPVAQAAKDVAKRTGRDRAEIYRLALALKAEGGESDDHPDPAPSDTP